MHPLHLDLLHKNNFHLLQWLIDHTFQLKQIQLNQLKSLANKQDVPYQSLVKTYLARQINQEIAN